MTQTTTSSILNIITSQQAWHYNIIPQKLLDNNLYILTAQSIPSSDLTNELELITGKNIILVTIATDHIYELLQKYYPIDKTDSRLQTNFYQGDSDGFLNHLINEARSLKSSDIHIEAYEQQCRVRIRIDGMLVQRYLLEKVQYPSLVNKIKIIANLDISEKRLPQDGRIFFENKDYKFDIRVSVLPTLHGEKVVLRLLNNDATDINIYSLGFSENDLKNYLEGIRRPNGILLISGPTGSGKTTTLYATLKILNNSMRNILTIEDPIEYTLEGINQVQVKDNIGLTFSLALRTFLRQDPNIIMLGEIRDVETANMAIRAALTGHLVLSTIHTNSAWGTISRLKDMGTPSFLLANTLNTSVAQRLVRLLCSSCKERTSFSESLYPSSFRPLKKITGHYVAKGCSECHNTGYKGRKAVYEVIPVDDELSYCIKHGEDPVNEKLKAKGIRSLSENAFDLFAEGETSIDEIYSLLVN